MAPSILSPRDLPQRGDILFTAGASFVSYMIRLGQLDGLSHCGVVVQVKPESVVLLEALSGGVVMNERSLSSITGYFVRPGTKALGEAVRDAAWEIEEQGISYSWSTICWQAGRMLRQSAARYLGFTILLGALLQKISRRRAALPQHMICSEFALASLCRGIGIHHRQSVETPYELGNRLQQLAAEPHWQSSPIDLFRAMAGRWG